MPLNTIEIVLDQQAGDPTTPPDGCIWYNATDDKIKAREGGATVELSDTTDANAVHTGDTAGGDLSGTFPNPTVDDGADGTAIHDNVSGEINAITEKASPVAGDWLLIEDSASANAKKKIQVGNLPSSGGGLAYVEKWSTFNTGSSGSWNILTLTGISANTIVEVLVNPYSNNINGVREVGSTLQRKDSSNRPFTLLVKTNGSSQVEVWADDYLNCDFVVTAELG